MVDRDLILSKTGVKKNDELINITAADLANIGEGEQ